MLVQGDPWDTEPTISSLGIVNPLRDNLDLLATSPWDTEPTISSLGIVNPLRDNLDLLVNSPWDTFFFFKR